jgi:hypothetical protein
MAHSVIDLELGDFTVATTMKKVEASLLALVSAAWLVGTPAAAAAPFDGSWTVNIASQSGACKSGSLPIEVRDGKIVSGNPTVNVQGQVADHGGLRVIVGDGVRKANGSGKLSGTSGSGTWSGGGGICSGTWVAERN